MDQCWRYFPRFWKLSPPDGGTLLTSRSSGRASGGSSVCATASCELRDNRFSSQQVPKIHMPLFMADAVEWATQPSLCKALNTARGGYLSSGSLAPALTVSHAVFCIISATGKMHQLQRGSQDSVPCGVDKRRAVLATTGTLRERRCRCLGMPSRHRKWRIWPQYGKVYFSTASPQKSQKRVSKPKSPNFWGAALI